MDYEISRLLDAFTSGVGREAVDRVRATSGDRIATMVQAALVRTLRDTITVGADGSAFVITGDIPAMWMRDSTTQLTPYLRFVEHSPALADLVAAVVRRQFACLAHDPYANAFNDGPTGGHFDEGDVCTDPQVWEQKYELDSLSYPVQLAHRLWRTTGRTDVFDETAVGVFRTLIAQWRLEQRHQNSPYRFVRDTPLATETLQRDGRGTPVGFTQMTWSGFRPSDDACTFGYNVPGNLQAAQALRCLADIATEVLDDADLAADATALSDEICAGVEKYGIVDGPAGERIYAYEVDGLGGVLCMDDANTPSLLSLPLVAPEVIDPDVWAATRRFVLSEDNPYYFIGTQASGVGSPHTWDGWIWPIALAVQGLTGPAEERPGLLQLIADTDGGTGQIHESFDPSDPSRFTREWFSWADSMFCELALQAAEDSDDRSRLVDNRPG